MNFLSLHKFHTKIIKTV